MLFANLSSDQMMEQISEGANKFESEMKAAPIYAAAMYGPLDELPCLLSGNVVIDYTSQNSAGYSALIYAIIKNRVDVVKCLLANGANVNHKTIEGSTALHGAANTRGNKDMLLLLIEAPRRGTDAVVSWRIT